MTEVEVKKTQESLQDRLAQVIELLQRQRVVEDLTHRQEGPNHDRVENLGHRQNLVELQRKLDDLPDQDMIIQHMKLITGFSSCNTGRSMSNGAIS